MTADWLLLLARALSLASVSGGLTLAHAPTLRQITSDLPPSVTGLLSQDRSGGNCGMSGKLRDHSMEDFFCPWSDDSVDSLSILI